MIIQSIRFSSGSLFVIFKIMVRFGLGLEEMVQNGFIKLRFGFGPTP